MTGLPITFPTPLQREAIEAPGGPVLVLAGPGAGKTSCLVARIRFLIEHRGLPPERICAVTFTNKAADEIAIRLADKIGRQAEDVTRGTIHSLCVRILRRYRTEVGLQAGFGIADEDYQNVLLGRLRVPRKQRTGMLNRFGRRRLQGYELTPDDERLYVQYQERLHAANMVDFDEIIVRTAGLLARRPDVAGEVAGQWDYLLVDECQDLSARQYDIIRALVSGHRNLFAVGDDEQSIFSWASADPQVLRQLANDFGISRPIILDENCRCSSRIFAAARRLIERNPPLFTKALRAGRESPFEVEAVTLDDEAAESRWVVADLVADRSQSGLPWGEYGILYRRHDSGALLEGRLLAAGIPCRLSRGRAIGDDRIIRQILASFRVMLHPGDEIAIEALGDLLLPSMLMDQVRTHFMEGGFLTGLRVFARANKRSPDAKKAWRFIYAVENLRAIFQSHRTLRGLITAVLSQGMGAYKNPLELEEVSNLLTDPANYPGAAGLAEQLRRVRQTGGRIWIPRTGGLELALRGMLVRTGFSLLSIGSGPADSADLVLVAPPDGGLSLLLFKALQLEESQEWEEPHRDFVAFDLETTDKDIRGCEIVEIGAARVRNGVIVDTFRSLVRCRRPISPKATEVHGYRDVDLAGAPPFEEVWPRFRTFVGNDLLVAHNGINFDVPVLTRLAKGLPGSDGLVFYDSLPLARSLSSLSARLEDLATLYGVATGRSHHAEDDAVALAQVYVQLHRTRALRARKAALTNLLDDLGLAMALDPMPGSPEVNRLREIARSYTLGRFGESLDNYARERSGDALPVDDVIDRLGGQSLMDRLRAERKPEERFPGVMARLETLVEAGESTQLSEAVQNLLDRIALSSSDVEVERDRVNLLTLHATKGLEFSRVYVIGVEDNEMPGNQALANHRLEEIEEARRLLYVGMTRAKDRLVLTRAAARRGTPAGDSGFLREIGLEPRPV